MTDEMKGIFSREEKRLALALVELEPIRECETYSTILDNIFHLQLLQLDDKEKIVGIRPHVDEDRPEPSIEEYSAPVMTPVEVTPEVTPTVTYTKEDVRAALAGARKKGTNVTELLAEFGVSNFSALPAGMYPQVMARLGES